ncbi:hypothetical protein KXW98_006977 [Aspergillus fumigatus]|nr:hypothetical protein KXX45_005694 [Aspergillus fumigatus]KAH1293832.1 hypothetical protein KXX30_003497 [Aspergillus fumigatus]KAH1296002.1 hypothetical protein KXX48_001483 [Aspergillus fumigatus]KAH1312670.1 hypothetical protein KXX66_007979 [Aspergillus fumigatus]KAH1381684.1 hypothetical protein KXX10_006846 [Aspergillus fumigatus]
MDFPGGSITNIRVIDGFSNIYWRIYTEEPNIATLSGDSPTNGFTILRHLSRLKDLELRLRNLDCLVSSYPRRLGLWVFSATPDFESLGPLCSNGTNDDPSKLFVDSATLKVSASGSVTSKELVKNLSAEPVHAATNSQGLQRRQNGPNPPRRTDGHGSSAAIYASFISAVTGALSLQLIRCNKAIPLGSRTLFTVVAEDYYDNPRIDNDNPAAVPSLTTLQIQLTSLGKLTVSLQTISQPGILRLCGPYDTSVGAHNAHPGCDLWLSPSGSIARLVATHSDSQNASPGHTIANPPNTSNLEEWKALVIEWLGNYGLPLNSSEDEPWVEVEVWEPFYSRLAGEVWRQNEEGASVLPLKRILWPARYCFTRKKPTSLDPFLGINDTFPVIDEPLGFAEKWLGMGQLNHETDSKPASRPEAETKDQETPLSRPDLPEGIESLSRAAEYPDLQASNLVYPTPPDGAFPVGPNPPPASDAAAGDLDSRHLTNRALVNVKSKEETSARDRSDHDVLMSFGPSPGLIVGSGLYDTNDDDDDDLFGEINQRDFGSKGITDADFSFFDDPEFNHLGGDVSEMDVGAQETPEIAVDAEEPKAHPLSLEQPLTNDNLPGRRDTTEQVDTVLAHPEEKISNLQPADVPLSANMQISSPVNEDNQTISPPLSPIEVKKTLFAGPNEDSKLSVQKGHLQGHYNPVAFKANILDWDQKYGAEGKFRVSGAVVNHHTVPASTTGDIPTIGLPRRNARTKNPYVPARNNDKPKSPASDVDQPLPSDSDFDSTSDTSDDSDGNLSNSDESVATFVTRKRKRARSYSGSSVNLPQQKPLARSEQSIATSRTDDLVFLGNFLSTFSDWSMTGYFSAIQKQLAPVLIRKDAQIEVAQLLVEQVTQSCLDHKVDGILNVSEFESKTYSLRTFLEDTAFMGEIERLDLNGFVSLQENSGLSPPLTATMSRQSSQRKENGKSSILKLAPPHLRIRRGKDYLEVLPPAISFWETFGLEPAYGSKDIYAYCIHPQTAAEAANDFLERLGLLYSSCNLGQHTRASRSTGFDRGMCSWNIGAPGEFNYHYIMQSLKSICDKLVTALLKSPPTRDSVVVYIINPFSHAAALADICSAFYDLFQKYIDEVENQQAGQASELVLQIVPFHFIMSTESLVVPPQAQYLSLALEVYSRCPPKSLQSCLLNCAPPMLIAEPVPKTINFKLAPDSSSPLQEAKSLHIACSRSYDQRWVSVSWTDNTGTFQRTLSYCLRFQNSNATRNILEVRTEIWAATKMIMEKTQARWKIIIANTEPVDQDEVDTWTSLVEQYNTTKPFPSDLTILYVNTTPDLYLEPPPQPLSMSVFNPQISSTPVATPNPSGNAFSPEQPGNAPTPPSGGNAPTPTEIPPDAESECLLTDICDESWGIILSHCLNSSPHLTDYRPALASGYLLRRKGPTDADGAFAMNVNLIYSQKPASLYENLLREIIARYRDLATLARARGTRTVQQNTFPWHIATALRAQELLSYVL